MSAKPWTGASIADDYEELAGVAHLTKNILTNLLAVVYFDSTTTFFDPILMSYMHITKLDRRFTPHKIIPIDELNFLSTDNERQIFTIQNHQTKNQLEIRNYYKDWSKHHVYKYSSKYNKLHLKS